MAEIRLAEPLKPETQNWMGHPGALVELRGDLYRVLSLSEDKQTLRVEPVREPFGQDAQ